MDHKKGILILILIFGLIGCTSIGANATYDIGTTSVNYNPSYNTYDVKLNNHIIGGAISSINTSSVKVGTQTVTWKDAKTGELHSAKNQVIITKEQLKGKKYLAAHLYPNDTVEITTSNNWPNPTKKGTKWLNQLKNNR
ncbi:hypothetical protein MMP61_09555 [Acinetobacter sp. NIPH 1958]|uniref:hypothetical protein n=1 Tax=unclassified Acinetobacter TaxID=196816 RepID=UPI000518D7EE|nr:hypothetical protein [Acinetobacter sp. ANC 3929]MCH7351492.1 hypothetical protein [Acinetobacter sp. NIPH 2023]MCH7355806.1 hypothetical protein [Acinetobacter sp. NIPH 1958]MCH7359169.1 hypothetical protein [Acinetobacter sp. NIPH 2024]